MLNKLKRGSMQVLSQAELLQLKGGYMPEGGGTDCWVCTETWQGWDPVVRNCCGSHAGCNKCIMTGQGCNVQCIAP